MESYKTLEKYLEANQVLDKFGKGSYIGLKKIAMGFCVYAANPGEFYKFNIDKRLRNAGLLNKGDSLDILVSCIYDDPRISTREYSAKVSHLNDIVWHHVPNKSIENHNFLKKLLETEEPEETYQIDFNQGSDALGIDKSEQFGTNSDDSEDRQLHEFNSENEIDEPGSEF